MVERAGGCGVARRAGSAVVLVLVLVGVVVVVDVGVVLVLVLVEHAVAVVATVAAVEADKGGVWLLLRVSIAFLGA